MFVLFGIHFLGLQEKNFEKLLKFTGKHWEKTSWRKKSLVRDLNSAPGEMDSRFVSKVDGNLSTFSI